MNRPSRTLVALVLVRGTVAIMLIAGSLFTLDGWGRLGGLLLAAGWIGLSIHWVREELRSSTAG